MIGIGWNVRERDQDPCGHAEIMALRAASQHQQRWHLDGCTVYVTLEPCAMCAGAMVLSRIARCVWAAPDPKGGYLGTLGNLGADSRLYHLFEVQGGLQQEASAEMLRAFFKRLRQRKR
jgi:tRNA(adenine34) deaminase